MIVDKLGFYKSRDGDLIEVTNVDTHRTSGGAYPISGRIKPEGDVFWYVDSWKTDGIWKKNTISENDIVEYLSPTEYPEMYI